MSDDPLIGKQLGDYTILSLLGRGGMSRVYRGYDENLDRDAAVKVISSDFATTSEEEYTRRFQTEARAIARLRHPNIVGVYQFGRSEGIYYMAMVFLEGQDLRTFLNSYVERRVYIPGAEILRIARDVATALDYAHEQGVIHRDIKPSNIMLEKHTGRAILMDFGLALSVHEGTTGDTFGSAHYIAPEQAISSAQAVPQSDLYSLGVVLYEMLAGKVPFDDPSAMSVALHHLNDAPPPMTLYNPGLSPEVEAVIMRALDKKPEHRYATGRELVDALEHSFQRARYLEPVPVNIVPPFIPVKDTEPTPWFGQPPVFSAAPAADTNPTPEPGALAQRFARYKARKAEEEVRELPEDQLAIDPNTLDSMLEGYADPRDIGLVGPEAAPVHPSRPSNENDLRESIARVPRARRPRRLGVLLLSVILLTGALVVAWYGFGPGKNEDAGESDNPQVIAGLLSTAEATDSATEALEGAPTEDAAPVASSTRTPTQPDATEEIAGASAAGLAVTEASTEPPSTPTRTPTRAASVTATEPPTPTEAAASPTRTRTAAPTRGTTVSATPRPTITRAASLTATETARPTASPTALAPTRTVTGEPALRLVYDQNALLLINISDEPQDISRLVFTQPRRDEDDRTFEASLWRASNASLAAVPSGACYQIVRGEATRVEPEDELCPSYLGWYQPGMIARYFWIAEEADATFTVSYQGDPAALATCEIAAEECLVALPSE